MQNKYENESNLTEYDLFMLQKKNTNSVTEATNRNIPSTKSSYVNELVNRTNYEEEYNNYMLQQINRKAPKELLTKEQFINNYVASATDNVALSSTSKVLTMDASENQRPSRKSENKFSKLFSNIQFKKGGKVLLILYVIIVLAVASTLLIRNTTNNNGLISADAQSNVNQSIAKEEVGAMVLENEEETKGNWFDRLCDALNK